MSNIQATFLNRPLTGSESNSSLSSQELINANFIPTVPQPQQPIAVPIMQQPQSQVMMTVPIQSMQVQPVPVLTQPPYYTAPCVYAEPAQIIREEIFPQVSAPQPQPLPVSGEEVSWIGQPAKTTETQPQTVPTTTITTSTTSNFPMTNTILNSTAPVEVKEGETVTVNEETGILANKTDVVNWQGPMPLDQYPINQDPNPEVIRKKTEQQLLYIQEIAIRYLRPPSPPPPGDIVIRQEKSVVPPPGPPIVIRQQPPRPTTPTPLIIREAPPRPPPQLNTKFITIPGKRVAPPPRKVIIERLPAFPPKPQSIIIERWLPFRQHKRKVVFQKPTEPEKFYEKPRNLIIQWEAPRVSYRKEYRDLGVVAANPSDYVNQFGSSLIKSDQLPDYVKEIRPPSGLTLAAQTEFFKYELEGDVYALSFIDLDREGLSEYREYVSGKYYTQPQQWQVKPAEWGTSIPITRAQPQQQQPMSTIAYSEYQSGGSFLPESTFRQTLNSAVKDSEGRIHFGEAKRILAKLNERLGRVYDSQKAERFVQNLDQDKDGLIDFEIFRKAVYDSI